MCTGSVAFPNAPMAPMHSPETIEIKHGPFLARVIPAWGGRVASLRHAEAGDILVPIEAENFDPLNWPKAGGYPLFPFHNRIRQSALWHEGLLHQMRAHPALDGDVMHGPAHQRPWEVKASSASSVLLRLDFTADADWPFSFTAEQEISVTDEGLTVSLRLINRSTDRMPCCFGWHPYLAANVSTPARTDARLSYPLDQQNLPTGEEPIERQTEDIPAEIGYTLHFRDWTSASYRLNDGGSVAVTADPVFRHIAVHRMPSYLCLEPVSGAAGVLNQPENRRGQMDLTVLEPGQQAGGSIYLSVGAGG